MNISAAKGETKAQQVEVSAEELMVGLSDGRKLHVPLAWFPRLFEATQAQRDNWQLLGGGDGIHWPEIDEDISVQGLLHGMGSPEAKH